MTAARAWTRMHLTALRASARNTGSPLKAALRGTDDRGVSTDAHAPRGGHAPTPLARALERAVPEPLLAIPPLLLAFGLLAVAPARFAADTWFGLAAGRDIARHGLPHSDRLTALTAGHPWQDQQWLAHLASYGLFRIGGLALVSLADAACLVTALCIAMLAARRLGGSPTWVTALASLLILIQIPSAARAQTSAAKSGIA